MNTAELVRLFAELTPEAKAELFRPYVWRDPARVTPERAAELARLDEAEKLTADKIGV